MGLPRHNISKNVKMQAGVEIVWSLANQVVIVM
jgi:hypothetical protein